MGAFSWMRSPSHFRTSTRRAYRSWLGAPAPRPARPLLVDLPAWQPQRIAALSSTLAHEVRHGLMELGMVPGTPVCVLYRVGEALMLQVRGTRLMLHQDTAAQIVLQDLPSRL